MDNTQKLSPQEIAKKLTDPKAYEEEQKRKAEATKRKADAELKKKADAAKIKPKFYFDVKVECMLPAVLTYKILAEDANQAADLIKGKAPNSIQHRLVGRKETALKVYDSGSTMMKLKRLLGLG